MQFMPPFSEQLGSPTSIELQTMPPRRNAVGSRPTSEWGNPFAIHPETDCFASAAPRSAPIILDPRERGNRLSINPDNLLQPTESTSLIQASSTTRYVKLKQNILRFLKAVLCVFLELSAYAGFTLTIAMSILGAIAVIEDTEEIDTHDSFITLIIILVFSGLSMITQRKRYMVEIYELLQIESDEVFNRCIHQRNTSAIINITKKAGEVITPALKCITLASTITHLSCLSPRMENSSTSKSAVFGLGIAFGAVLQYLRHLYKPDEALTRDFSSLYQGDKTFPHCFSGIDALNTSIFELVEYLPSILLNFRRNSPNLSVGDKDSFCISLVLYSLCYTYYNARQEYESTLKEAREKGIEAHSVFQRLEHYLDEALRNCSPKVAATLSKTIASIRPLIIGIVCAGNIYSFWTAWRTAAVILNFIPEEELQLYPTSKFDLTALLVMGFGNFMVSYVTINNMKNPDLQRVIAPSSEI